MDSGNRKRPADVAGDAPRRPARSRAEEAAAAAAVTDDEVEEFFRILRQMRDVSQCLAAPGGPRPGPGTERSRGQEPPAERWSPKFAWEDFAPAGGGDGARNERPQEAVGAPTAAPAPAEEERVAENGAPRVLELDLNAEPETEGLVGSPSGDGTARCARAPA